MKNLRQFFSRSGWLSSPTRRSPGDRVHRGAAKRRLNSETLEKRELLAGDIALAHNYLAAEDVDQNRAITAADALAVLNFINTHGSGVQITSGMDVPGMIDVNRDHHVTAADALAVINALNLGEAVGEVVELQLTPRAPDDTSLLDGSRNATVDVGELFYLEFAYSDLRDVNERLGAFQISTDIGVSEAGALEPVLTEIQTLRISGINRAALSGNQLTGSFFFNLAGRAESPIEITASQFRNTPAVVLIGNVLNQLGYTSDQFRIANLSSAPTTAQPNPDFIFQIRFIDLDLANQDLPDLVVTNTIQNNPTTVTTPVTTTPPVINGQINGAALASTMDVRSRTFQQSGISNLEYYNQRQFGTFDATGTVATTGATGNAFEEVGAIGRVNAGGIPAEDGRQFIDQPFDTFALPVRFTRPVSNFVISLNPAEDDEAILLYPGGEGTRLTQDDVLIGADASFTITAVGAQTNPGTLSITPTIQVNEGAGTATFTVSRTGGSDGAVAVNFATADGTATAGSDYTSTSGVLNFADGETSRTISVPITDDATVEGNETFTVVLTNATGGATLGTATSTATIVDNDAAPQPGVLAFAAATASVNESAGTVTFTVNRTGGTNGTVTVAYATANGSATAPADYTSTSGTLTFNEGQTTQTFTVPIINDSIDEPNETFTVTLTGPTGGATLGTIASVTATIVDDDTANSGVISIDPTSVNVNEGAGTVTLTVNRTGGSSGAVGVSFATGGGTATAGSDYTVASGTLNFADGDVAPKTITVSIINDTTVESNETFNVSLSNVTGGATLGTAAQSVVTIVDNDTQAQPGSLAFNPAAVSVDESAGTVTLTVARTGGSDGTVTVAFATGGGTATAGSDYTTASGTLTFNPGETSRTIVVSVINDTTDEVNETFNVTLSNPTGGATLGTASTAVVTIVDNDDPVAVGTLAITPATLTVSEGAGTATLTVTRTGGSAGAVSVNFATANGSATAGSDYTAQTGTLTFASGETSRTISIPITEDTLVEGNETFTVTLSNATGGASLGNATSTVTITDNDAAVPGTLSFASATRTVSESAGTVSLVVSRTGGADGAVSVNFATSNGTALAGSDYVAASGTVNFAAGETSKTISITINEDSLDEPNETFTVTLSNAAGGASLGSISVATVTIEDNDLPGNIPGSTISGSVFIDLIENTPLEILNGAAPIRDGMLDSNERGFGGIAIQLVSQTPGVSPVTVFTNLDGSYSFSDVAPGTYQIVYDIPDSVVYGYDVAGAMGVDTNADGRISVTIPQAGGVTLNQLNFASLATRGTQFDYLDILASTYLNNNRLGASLSDQGAEGGLVSLSSSGNQEFVMIGSGFDDALFAEFLLGDSNESAILLVVNSAGQVLAAQLDSSDFVVTRSRTNDQGEMTSGQAVRFFGGFDDFDFVDANSFTPNRDFSDFAAAVDDLLSRM